MKNNSSKSIFSKLSSDGATLAKLIATFSVVLTHSYKLFRYNGLDETKIFYLRGFHAFASCGVPVFFLLSGYFLVLKGNWNWKVNLRKKIKSLMLPYILFILLYAVVSCIGSLFLPKFFDDFRNFTIVDWYDHLIGIPFISGPQFYGPLWFVRDLIILNILSFIIAPIAKKVPGYILLPIMAIVYFLPIPQFVRYSIPFFVAGIYCGTKKKLPVICNRYIIALVFAVGMIISVSISGELSWKVSVLLMAAFILSVSGTIVNNNSVNNISHRLIKYSFPIYLLHEYPMTVLMRILALKHISLSLSVFAFFISPWVIIALCIFVIIVWRRCLPKVFALFVGGR